MAIIKEIRRRSRKVIGPLIGLLLVTYFTFHVIHGDRGLFSWMKLNQELEKVRIEHDEVKAKREALEHRVKLLRPDSLDPDMLEERARVMLNYLDPEEKVIFYRDEEEMAADKKTKE